MVQVGNVKEINNIKSKLESLKKKGLVKQWELPYENILTRLTAAIFFVTAADKQSEEKIWEELGKEPMFTYRVNEEKKLSQLEWRVEFNKGFEI
jgi:hypothetical protein